MTPTIVVGRSLIVTTRPTIDSSPPNRRCHRPCADDRDRGCPRRLVSSDERASAEGCGAEHGEDLGARDRGRHLLGLAVGHDRSPCPRSSPPSIRTCATGGPSPRSSPARPRTSASPAAGCSRRQNDQPVALRKWQRLQHDGVDDAEDGGRRADAERQREHGHGGEARLLTEQPQGVSQVVSGASHGGSAQATRLPIPRRPRKPIVFR